MRRVASLVASSRSPSARPGSAERAPCRGGPVWRPLGMLSSGGGRGSRSRKLAAEAAVPAALTRARQLRGLEDGGRGRGHGRWGRRRRQGPRERGAPQPTPLIRWGQSPGLRPGRRLRRLSNGSREARSAESWAGRARAFAASWAPSLGHRGHQPQEPPGLLAAEPERPPGSPASPPSALFSSLLSLLLPLQLSVMATEPPSPLRLEAPGPPEMRTPPAGETSREGTLKPAGSRLRFLNGCVPLSHQVAGHMYGKDKVGKWGWRGARRTPSAFASPGPAEVAWGSLAVPDAPPGVYAAPPVSSAFPQSLATRAAGARKVGRFLGCGASDGQQEVAGRGVSALPREGGY